MNSFFDGYTDTPKGKLSAIVTSLEMLSAPTEKYEAHNDDWSLELVSSPKNDWYKNLFRRIGEEWLWFSRLQMNDYELQKIITDPKVSIYVFRYQGAEEGLVELDFRIDNECELSFFGITSKLIGNGIGRWMMNKAIQLAWSKPIHRFWVHTCTLDGPNALSFYIRSGFRPFKRQIEVFDDPRVKDIYPRSTAPHIPLL